MRRSEQHDTTDEPTLARRIKGAVSKGLLAAVSLILALAAAEGLIRVTALDITLIEPVLHRIEPPDGMHYIGAPAIYRPSDKPGLLYEVIPNIQAEADHQTHPAERKYRRVTIKTNSLGFRGPERTEEKPPGTRRIVMLGGSNTWGASISNEDTISAQLEAYLNVRLSGRTEVWNGGLSADVMSHKVLRAEEIITRYAPDLVIFQHSNHGRRGFMFSDSDVASHFRREPALYSENLPLLVEANPEQSRLHRQSLRSSGLYRALIAAHLRLILWHHVSSCSADPLAHITCLDPELRTRLNAPADRQAWEAWSRFVQRHPNLPVLVVDPISETWCSNRHDGAGEHEDTEFGFMGFSRPEGPNLHYYSPCNANLPDEYQHIHPPSHVYTWYAEQLAEQILVLGRQADPSFSIEATPANTTEGPTTSDGL